MQVILTFILNGDRCVFGLRSCDLVAMRMDENRALLRIRAGCVGQCIELGLGVGDLVAKGGCECKHYPSGFGATCAEREDREEGISAECHRPNDPASAWTGYTALPSFYGLFTGLMDGPDF